MTHVYSDEAEAAQGLDEARLARLIAAFYARVRADGTLGPVFEEAVEDWPAHLARLAAFWSSLMLTSGRYKGDPFGAHRKHLHRLTPAMFDRWLALWREATEQEAPDAAAALQLKAERVAASLRRALWTEPAQAAAGDDR